MVLSIYYFIEKAYNIYDMVVLSKDQLRARDTILEWIRSKKRSSYLTIGGYAGTGKSSLIAEVRKILPPNWKVAFAAYTGKASGVMKKDTGLNVFERKYHIDYNLIIVDEASMVNEDLFHDLRMYGIPILFVGDHGQLPPISSDDFNLMTDPVIKLEEVHRFGDNTALLDLSVMAREGTRIPFKQFDDKVAKVKEDDPLVNDFIMNRLGDFSDGICLCGTNNTRADVNQLIRLNYGVISDIDDKVPKVGDRVVCLRNNRALVDPIYNGMLGKINSISDIPNPGCQILNEAWNMSISVDDGFIYKGMVNKHHFGELKYSTDGKEFVTVKELMQMKSKLTIRERKLMRGKFGNRRLYFDAFDFGYCLTVHKSQGSEWGNVMLFEETSGYWDEDYRRKWLYTAITRSNNRLLIIG